MYKLKYKVREQTKGQVSLMTKKNKQTKNFVSSFAAKAKFTIRSDPLCSSLERIEMWHLALSDVHNVSPALDFKDNAEVPHGWGI